MMNVFNTQVWRNIICRGVPSQIEDAVWTDQVWTWYAYTETVIQLGACRFEVLLCRPILAHKFLSSRDV